MMEMLAVLTQAQPDLSIGAILDVLSKAGLLGGCIVLIYLLVNDILYTKGRVTDIVSLYKDRIESLEAENKDLREDRDDWRSVAKEKVGVLDDAVELAATRLRRRKANAT